ncbi:MAG: DUF4242 domain-containing protein [Deltaproteobacteria bacterium]|nr:DUF4242 domain-containing protein [Deltaproteobacteria bacterium]
MSTIVMERRRAAAMREADVLAEVEASRWCRDAYRVGHHMSLLAHDGRRVVCQLEAPDVEAVRSVLDRLGEVAERLWPASLHGGSGPLAVREVVVVERDFPAAVGFDELQAREDAAAWCLEAHRVVFLRTLFAADRRRMLCLYTAPDAESVRRAQQQAAMPVSSVWPAHVVVAPRRRGD